MRKIISTNEIMLVFSSYQSALFSVMDKLPATSYVRMVDIWLIFVQLYPFIEENPLHPFAFT